MKNLVAANVKRTLERCTQMAPTRPGEAEMPGQVRLLPQPACAPASLSLLDLFVKSNAVLLKITVSGRDRLGAHVASPTIVLRVLITHGPRPPSRRRWCTPARPTWWSRPPTRATCAAWRQPTTRGSRRLDGRPEPPRSESSNQRQCERPFRLQPLGSRAVAWSNCRELFQHGYSGAMLGAAGYFRHTADVQWCFCSRCHMNYRAFLSISIIHYSFIQYLVCNMFAGVVFAAICNFAVPTGS